MVAPLDRFIVDCTPSNEYMSGYPGAGFTAPTRPLTPTGTCDFGFAAADVSAARPSAVSATQREEPVVDELVACVDAKLTACPAGKAVSVPQCQERVSDGCLRYRVTVTVTS
jgi:hypothetical protein